MTPPAAAPKSGKPGPAPVYELPGKAEKNDKSNLDSGKNPGGIPLQAGKAKTAPTKDDLKNLLPFIGDEQVFGMFAKTVTADKSKKYSKVKTALEALRKYLKGDEAQAAVAKQAVVTWLSDPVLLEDNIGTHARKNLVWVLKRAEGDAGADGVREALKANYVEKANEAPPKQYTKKEIQDSLSDDKIFGDQVKSYQAESTEKYRTVNMALIYVGKVVSGDAKTEVAKARIETWLKDEAILRDPVALTGRRALIKALSVSTTDATLAANIKTLVDSLKADYSNGEKQEAVKPAPADEPKKEEPKKEEPKPEEAKPAEPPPAEKVAAPAVFNYPPPKFPGKRKDNFASMIKIIKEIFQASYTAYQKTYPTLQAEMVMNFKTDNKNGAVVEVVFSGIQIQDPAHKEVVNQMLKQIADEMNKKISHEKQGSESYSEVEWPKVSFKPPAKADEKQ